jgi:hypothetical protein
MGVSLWLTAFGSWAMHGSLVEWLTMLGEWAIAGVIVYEGKIALKEYRSVRLFDAIKYVEDSETRTARKMIYDKLIKSAPPKDWWRKNILLADAAATVCARYNLLAAVTKDDSELRRFVVREWANNICTNYEALRDYMRYREASNTGPSNPYRCYAELYVEARNLGNNSTNGQSTSGPIGHTSR